MILAKLCEQCGDIMNMFPIFEGTICGESEYRICADCASKLPDPWAEPLEWLEQDED